MVVQAAAVQEVQEEFLLQARAIVAEQEVVAAVVA
jgi:hypothetical protein